MTDIDAMLARLRESPVHPGLAMIDASVLAELATCEKAPAPLGTRAFGMAAIMALAIGVAGSAFPGAPATAAVLPVGVSSALAPSTLLGVDW